MLSRLGGSGQTCRSTAKLSPIGWRGVGVGVLPHDQDAYVGERALERPQHLVAGGLVAAPGGHLLAQEPAHRRDPVVDRRQRLGPVGGHQPLLDQPGERAHPRPGPVAHPIPADGSLEPVEERHEQRLPHRRRRDVEHRVDLRHPARQLELAVGRLADEPRRGEQAVEVVVAERGRVERLDEPDHAGVDGHRAGRLRRRHGVGERRGELLDVRVRAGAHREVDARPVVPEGQLRLDVPPARHQLVGEGERVAGRVGRQGHERGVRRHDQPERRLALDARHDGVDRGEGALRERRGSPRRRCARRPPRCRRPGRPSGSTASWR